MSMVITRRSALGMLAAVGLLACSGGGDNKGGGDSTATSGTPNASAAAGGKKTFTIAMIAKSSTNPVFLSGRAGAEAAAKELSQSSGVDVKIDWLTPPNEDAAVQAQRIAQAVNTGADAILFAASDAGKVVGAINEAVDRGVPVMTFDSDVPQSKRFSFYGGDDAAMGRQVVAELATQMGGRGKIAILGGNQNAPNLQKRVKGVKDEAGGESVGQAGLSYAVEPYQGPVTTRLSSPNSQNASTPRSDAASAAPKSCSDWRRAR